MAYRPKNRMIRQEEPICDFSRQPLKIFVARERVFCRGVVVLVDLVEPGAASLGVGGAGGPLFSVNSGHRLVEEEVR